MRITAHLRDPSSNHRFFGISVKTTSIAPGSRRAAVRGDAELPYPRFFRAIFTLTTTGDTFLDIHLLGKGAVWINGHNLGRFWSVGPQQTLYVPGPWLHTGSNEIVVFDLLPQLQESVQGLDHPILDGAVSDKTISNQE
jgi:beta-galactosidase GanA